MRECRQSGSVRGALSNERPYRDNVPRTNGNAGRAFHLCWKLKRRPGPPQGHEAAGTSANLLRMVNVGPVTGNVASDPRRWRCYSLKDGEESPSKCSGGSPM